MTQIDACQTLQIPNQHASPFRVRKVEQRVYVDVMRRVLGGRGPVDGLQHDSIVCSAQIGERNGGGGTWLRVGLNRNGRWRLRWPRAGRDRKTSAGLHWKDMCRHVARCNASTSERLGMIRRCSTVQRLPGERILPGHGRGWAGAVRGRKADRSELPLYPQQFHTAHHPTVVSMLTQHGQYAVYAPCHLNEIASGCGIGKFSEQVVLDPVLRSVFGFSPSWSNWQTERWSWLDCRSTKANK